MMTSSSCNDQQQQYHYDGIELHSNESVCMRQQADVLEVLPLAVSNDVWASSAADPAVVATTTTTTTTSTLGLYGLISLAAAVAGLVVLSSSSSLRNKKKKKAGNTFRDLIALQRKLEFLSRSKNLYGYKETSGGYIDDWRPIEFPSLLRPIGYTTKTTMEDEDDQTDEDKEVYLDYAGSALPTQTQLLSMLQKSSSSILANPHSTGPAASRTLTGIQQAQRRVLQHFNGLPGRFASIVVIGDGDDDQTTTTTRLPPGGASLADCHSGYEVLFTSGTTEALRIVAERFPWQQKQKQQSSSCQICQRKQSQSVFLYAQNSHTSVVGMRQVATNKQNNNNNNTNNNATTTTTIFQCRTIQEIEKMTRQDFERLAKSSIGSNINNINNINNNNNNNDDDHDCPHCHDNNNNNHNLLAFPAECNFGGYRPPTKVIRRIIKTARSAGFYTLLDIAKAASTGPVDLLDLNPDFACVSFYKLFGAPTGLGALLVKKSTLSTLFAVVPHHSNNDKNNGKNDDTTFTTTTTTTHRHQSHPFYTGGGSVDILLPNTDICVPKLEPSPLASWTSGSVHFHGILQLIDGFDELERRGGMTRIHEHATCLARELVRRLDHLKHGNGCPIADIYQRRRLRDWRGDRVGDDDYDDGNDNGDEQIQQYCYGPTVALNLLRDDGSVVGYNEVSKLAALSQPALQFRTGCFCNPGACQEALGMTDRQAISNYETSGHVCGDHIDLVDGRPTGAIRVSFGKDSLWEDLDAFVVFVERTFVNHSSDSTITICRHGVSDVLKNDDPATMARSSGPKEIRLSEVYLFPIKSCAAQSVSRWRLELPSGKLLHDREFALVDSSGAAMRLQSYPKMALIRPCVDLDSGRMTISAPGCENLVLSLDDSTAYHSASENIVKVCGNKCRGRLWGDYKVSEWFSSFLGVSCWLARYSNGEYKTAQQLQTIDGHVVVPPSKVSFANEQPLLLISENAVDTLNQVLKGQHEKPVGTRHFRPNLVVKSFGDDEALSHIEDEWKHATMPSKRIALHVKGNCARCAMVDFDPTTGSKNGKTLKAMAKYRRRNGQITFGIFLQASAIKEEEEEEDKDDKHHQDAWIEVGDELRCE